MGIPQRYTAGTGCWRVVQAGRPTCADADAQKGPILVSAWPPAGPREARVLVKPLRSNLYYHRPAGSDLYASDYGYRAPQTRSQIAPSQKDLVADRWHMISATRAAYAPPAARTRHISRGDTQWTIPQFLDDLLAILADP